MSGFQHSIRAQVALSANGLDKIPMVNVENACASGSTALHSGWMAVKAGIYDCVLAIGAEADVTIIDPHARWTVDPSQFRSKSTNTPFAGWELKGRADVVIVVAYGKMMPERLFDIPQHGFINLHPSLLPRHRGPSPIQWALVCGDRATGVTTMQIDQGMDTGPILLLERE